MASEPHSYALPDDPLLAEAAIALRDVVYVFDEVDDAAVTVGARHPRRPDRLAACRDLRSAGEGSTESDRGHHL